MAKTHMTFEESLKKLEEIVRKLEDPEVPLQAGFALYEEGVRLTQELKKELNGIEKKVKVLQRDQTGKMVELDFESETNDDQS